MESGHVIKIGNRSFRPCPVTTLQQDVFFWKRARTAGLHSLAMLDGEAADDFAVRILGTLMESEAMFEMIGASLVPDDPPGAEWSPESALEIARYVATRSTPEEKAAVQSCVLTLVAGFFASGLNSMTRSRSSSTSEAKAEGSVQPG